MLSLQNISAGYGGGLVLRNVTADIGAGEFVGMVGPNGCGKTTLLRVISGVLPFREGRVQFGNRNVGDIGRRELARTMAYLMQNLSLDLDFTVREVALMGRSPHVPRLGGETEKDFQITQRAMDLADVSHLADRPITEVSGGERQRAFIAMCLAQEPEVFLLDEPTSHLDIGHQLSILDLIARLNRQTGVTVIAVFHDLNLAAEYCRRLLVLDRGCIAASGTPLEVLTPEIVAKVYGATVRIERNPLSDKPHVVVAAGMNDAGRQQAARPPALGRKATTASTEEKP